jgi:hypothetical protein
MHTAYIIALMMEAVSTYEISVYIYETTWHYIPEGYHLHPRYCENLKPHSLNMLELCIPSQTEDNRAISQFDGTLFTHAEITGHDQNGHFPEW